MKASRWSSRRWPLEAICIATGLTGLLTASLGLILQNPLSPLLGLWAAAAASAGLATCGAVGLFIRHHRRNRGLILEQGQRPAPTFAAIALLLLGALVSTLWPPATRGAWLVTVLGLGCTVGALWLGLRLARAGLPAPFRQAQRLYLEGDPEAALRALDDLAEQRHDFYGVDQLRAQIHRERGEYAAALALSEHLIARRPDLYYGFAEKGLTQLAQGEAAQALESFLRATQVAPYLPEAHFNLGMAAAEAKDLARSADAMALALRLGISDQVTELIARYQLHQALKDLGHLEPAARELRRLKRMTGTLGEWRASLSEPGIARQRRRADMALSARIERVMHT